MQEVYQTITRQDWPETIKIYFLTNEKSRSSAKRAGFFLTKNNRILSAHAICHVIFVVSRTVMRTGAGNNADEDESQKGKNKPGRIVFKCFHWFVCVSSICVKSLQ
jgi:hypothetical protein